MAKENNEAVHPVAQNLLARRRVKAAEYAEVRKMTPAQLRQAKAAADEARYGKRHA